MNENNHHIIIFKSDDGNISVDVRFEKKQRG